MIKLLEMTFSDKVQHKYSICLVRAYFNMIFQVDKLLAPCGHTLFTCTLFLSLLHHSSLLTVFVKPSSLVFLPLDLVWLNFFMVSCVFDTCWFVDLAFHHSTFLVGLLIWERNRSLWRKLLHMHKHMIYFLFLISPNSSTMLNFLINDLKCSQKMGHDLKKLLNYYSF